MSHAVPLARYLQSSLICAGAFPAAILLLFVLEATHVKEDPLMAADNARVGKVFVCVAMAVSVSTLSVVFAVRPLVCRDFRPLLWLVPLILGWLGFLRLFLWPWFEHQL